jgi:hypothetical protein
MERIFLAIIVSGLLLAAVSTTLLVLSSGGTTTVSVNVPVPGPLPEKPRK